ICGLPLFSGFISEWLIYNALFQGVLQFGGVGAVWASVAVIALALIGGLAAACFAKTFGSIFLGKNRSVDNEPHREGPWTLLAPMAMLAVLCVGIGLFPQRAVAFAFEAAKHLLPDGASLPADSSPAPLMPLVVFLNRFLPALLVFMALKVFLSRKALQRRSETWGCGYGAVSSRMQYTASSFAGPILRFFRGPLLFKSHAKISFLPYFPSRGEFHSGVVDFSEHRVFRPVFGLIERAARTVRRLQSGHTQMYLTYLFLALLGLLLWKLY
ncbi:MAG: hypothetical protein HYT89_06550, partial [Candidatus Omnitrophica bacterium]|nr:hypothetical protein [Candidatus Omnitrophota bacterium]